MIRDVLTSDGSRLIERLRVEEGFLGGLDLAFTPGLNVVIGARGAGKTSVIELIRYCLDVDALTDLTDTRAREHALGVLNGGSVTVQRSTSEGPLTATRSPAADQSRSEPGGNSLPMIFSQNEIEIIGADAVGRRRLLDSFHPLSVEDEQSILSRIATWTTQLRAMTFQLNELATQQASLKSAPEDLEKARKEQETLLATQAETAIDQERLATLDAELSRNALTRQALDRLVEAASSWRGQVEAAIFAYPSIEPVPDLDTGPLGGARSHLDAALSSVRDAEVHINTALASVEPIRASLRDEAVKLTEESSQIRSRLESVAKGAGAVATRITALQQSADTLTELGERMAALQDQFSAVRAHRETTLDALDALRHARFAARTSEARKLNKRAGPHVQVRVVEGGDTAAYAQAIAELLRGSRLHYNQLAPLLARGLSPRELVEAIEQGNYQLIGQLSGLDPERARSIVSYAENQELEGLLTCRIDDSVDFELLVGGSYRSTESLSTGQRCTAVLAILLQVRGRPILLDQPEDHLDNAFVVDTLVPSLRQRGVDGQLIVSTHNPNIPVLGEAERVIVLGSDGDRGFVESAERLDASESVIAITDLMEGGADAFRRRAEFYGSTSTSG